MSHRAFTILSMTGNITEFIVSFSIKAWARLFISSDVQAKWKNSSTCKKV